MNLLVYTDKHGSKVYSHIAEKRKRCRKSSHKGRGTRHRYGKAKG